MRLLAQAASRRDVSTTLDMTGGGDLSTTLEMTGRGGYAQDRKGEKKYIFEIVIPFVDIFRVEIIKNY